MGRSRPVLRSPESEVIEESCTPLPLKRSRDGVRDTGDASIVLLSVRVWPALRWVESVVIAMTGLQKLAGAGCPQKLSLDDNTKPFGFRAKLAGEIDLE